MVSHDVENFYAIATHPRRVIRDAAIDSHPPNRAFQPRISCGLAPRHVVLYHPEQREDNARDRANCQHNPHFFFVKKTLAEKKNTIPGFAATLAISWINPGIGAHAEKENHHSSMKCMVSRA